MSKFFRFEIRYWLRRPMPYIFFVLFFGLAFGALTSDAVQIGSGAGTTHANAPVQIQIFFAVLSVIGLVIITSFFNATATRDYTSGMDQIVFATPVKKAHFFFGKFFGVFTVAILPYTGITLAAWMSPYMPWVDPLHYGPFSWGANINGFLLFSVFNTFFGGAIIYAFAIYFRNPVLSYLASFGLIVLYGISNVLTRDIANQHLSILLDPLGPRSFSLYTQYWSPAQRNSDYATLSGTFLVNRLLWAGIGALVLLLLYRLFDFTQPRARRTKSRAIVQEVQPTAGAIPVVVGLTRRPEEGGLHRPEDGGSRRPLYAWRKQLRFELRSITRNNAFIILTVIALINLLLDMLFNTGNFGQKNLPVTYSVAELISGNMLLFMFAFIVFYSGYVVFRETEVRLDEIVDATPVSTGSVVTAKLSAVLLAIVLIEIAAIVMGMLYQLLNGFTNIEPGVYLRSLGMDLLGLAFLLIIAYLIQLLVGNKYIGYVVIVVFLVCHVFLWQALRIDSNMVRFGKLPNVVYSDMNGLGPFVPGIVGFGLYWSLFCSLLLLVIIGMSLRGKENSFHHKTVRLGRYLRTQAVLSMSLLLLFLAWGGWMYYNTKILNSYVSGKEVEQHQADYEKQYKKDESLPLPFTTALNYTIDLFPAQRSMHVNIRWWVKNIHSVPIDTVTFNMPNKATHVVFAIPGATVISEDKRLYYNVYRLGKPLAPGDSIELSYTADFINKGIENEVSFTQLTYNGSFFHDGDIRPVIGYSLENELTNTQIRRKYGLPRRERLARLTRDCTDTCNTSYINNSATWVDLTTTISTSNDQTAVAPGALIKQWQEKDRNYFTYRLPHKALDFFSFISAQYLVKRDSIDHIAVEIYYDKHHPYNVDRMTGAVKKALHYYTENFGPYYQQECRIIEFPRYAGYAQAFPGTMPYSEAVGFINDLRDTSTLDLVTYVVSHEMGHQWWAHQVIGPAMQGSESFSEGLAQYSALMVMKKEYGPEKMSRFLKYELDNYLRGRAQEKEYENPLMRTENQQYIHYNKASLVYYYMQEMIGEKRLDSILKNIVTQYAYTNPPFPTAFNVVDEIRKGTPDSLSYLITDLFENITLFDNRVNSVKMTRLAAHRYRVDMQVHCEKLRCDSLGKETPIPMNDYIDVGIFQQNWDNPRELGKAIVSQRIRMTGRDTTLSFIVDKWPYQAGIDPYHYLIDKVIADNVKTVTE
jgi:ABC-2 type transport system permease protein